MRAGRTLLPVALAAAICATTADFGGAAQQTRSQSPKHEYAPVRVKVRPSPVHPTSRIRVSFDAPFDLQPGDVWNATFVTCARTTRKRFVGFTNRSQYINDKTFSGGMTAGAKAKVTLKRSDVRGSKKRRWCKGTAVLAIYEADPDEQVEGGSGPRAAEVVEFLRIRGGLTAAYEDVFKPVLVKPSALR